MGAPRAGFARGWHTLGPESALGWPTLCGFCKGWAPLRFVLLSQTLRKMAPSTDPLAGGPEKGFHDSASLSVDRDSRLRNFPVAQKRGGCPRFGVGTWVLGLPSLPLSNIHRKQRLLPAKVVRSATPRPIPRMFHQARLYRIGVHVIQLLPLFFPAIHIEIVKPRPPERPQRFTRHTAIETVPSEIERTFSLSS
jgi:hypothetical protein